MTNTTTAPRLFVTDYASYNSGQQFKHGHWVDLSDFSDADEFNEYLEQHFEKAGINDPEIMFTDFEGFPKTFYSESYDTGSIENIFKYMEAGFEDFDDSEWVALHNEYCQENNYDDEIFEFDDDFFGTFFSDKPMEAARATAFGNVNFGHEYIRFNGYGNLETTDNPEEWVDKDVLIQWKIENL
jgi:hypothetical protein